MVVSKTKKIAYFAHLEECLNNYARAAIVHADFVGSKQISDIRIALRGKAELVFGKNTMIRKCIRDMCKEDPHPEWMAIVDVMRGNLGFIFTNGDLDEVLELLKQFTKPAAAKAGVVAPCSCGIPKGPTGLDPAQTSFFQALNIATKINKGSIEIINDVTVIHEGDKVGSSEAALLAKLGVKPFEYGLVVKYIYEGGVFSPDVLNIKDADLMKSWNAAVGFVAQLSLATNYLTECSLPCVIGLGFKTVLALAVEVDYIEFPQAQQVKDFLENPDAFLASVPSGGGGGGGGGGDAPKAAAAAAPPPPEEEEEEEEEMGFDLFD